MCEIVSVRVCVSVCFVCECECVRLCVCVCVCVSRERIIHLLAVKPQRRTDVINRLKKGTCIYSLPTYIYILYH